MENGCSGMFSGIKIMVSDHLPDDTMFVNPNAWRKMQMWFEKNYHTTKLEEDFKPAPNIESKPLLCPECKSAGVSHLVINNKHKCCVCGAEWKK